MKAFGFGSTVIAFSFIASTFIASTAYAYPAVNDQAKFTGRLTAGEGVEVPIEAEISLISYNAETKQYRSRSVTTVGGQVESKEEILGETDLLTQAAIQALIADCKGNGGETARVTVPAGTYDSCVIAANEAGSQIIYSIADVPFGLIKTETTHSDGSHAVLELASVHAGE